MKLKNEIKSYIAASGSTITEVAEAMGTTQANLSNKLARESLRYIDAEQMADILGYDLVWVPRNDKGTIVRKL